jgi:hypothetical protein
MDARRHARSWWNGYELEPGQASAVKVPSGARPATTAGFEVRISCMVTSYGSASDDRASSRTAPSRASELRE